MSYHQSRFKMDPKRAIVWKTLVQYLHRNFNIGNAVLDLGCGYGDFINHCEATQKYAVDASPEVKEYIDPAASFFCSTLPCELPIESNSLDTVFASNILEHLTRAEIDTQLKETLRCLKKDGIFMVFGPNYRRAFKNYYDDYTHVTAISHVSMTDWLNASGFEVTYCHPGLMPFSIKDSKVPVTSWLIRLWLWSPFKPGGAQMLVVGKKK